MDPEKEDAYCDVIFFAILNDFVISHVDAVYTNLNPLLYQMVVNSVGVCENQPSV